MSEQEAIERLREDVRRNPEGGTVYMDIDDARALLDREKRLTEALGEIVEVAGCTTARHIAREALEGGKQ